jgi:hypothetical protein
MIGAAAAAAAAAFAPCDLADMQSLADHWFHHLPRCQLAKGRIPPRSKWPYRQAYDTTTTPCCIGGIRHTHTLSLSLSLSLADASVVALL